MPTKKEIKKILDKIEPLLVKLDEITGKDNLLITAENMQRTEAMTRANTAKQIFAELDKIAWQQIEPEKLEKFYNEFSKAKDNVSALAIVQKFSIIGFSAKKYDNVKKKWEYK